MSTDRFYSVYRLLPVALQNVACSAYGLRQVRLRFNREFERNLETLLSTEWRSIEDISSFQDEQITNLIRYAYRHVPYYRGVMQQRKLRPRDIRCVADLCKLPILTKEDLRAQPSAFQSEIAAPSSLVFRHTSGTTGKALQFYVHRRLAPFQWALWWRHRIRFGLRTSDYHVNFTGQMVVPPEQRNPPFWRHALPMHQVVVGMQHITPQKVESMVQMLNERRFTYFSGYPSVLHSLTRLALDQGINLLPGSRPRVVAMGAENTLENQRRDIEGWTGAVVTDQYGFTEGCGNASQCEFRRYHEDFEFGALECVPEGTEEAEGTRGRIICTGFLSKEFPLIRYEVGDIGVWHNDNDPCPCGRHSRTLKSIDGRIDDYVITPEGHRLMRFDYLFKDTVTIRECQVVQESLGEVVFRIVRRSDYSLRDEAEIRHLVKEFISPTIRVKFDYVADLPRTRSGKLQAVVSELSRKQRPSVASPART